MSDNSWPQRPGGPFPQAGPRLLTPRVLAAAEPFLAVAGIGAWHYIEGGQLWWSEETRAIHGVAADFVPTLAAAIEFYLPEHRAIVSDGFRAVRLTSAILSRQKLPRYDGK